MDTTIQNTAENQLNYLTAEDKFYIDNLFAIYSSHVAHTSNLLQFIKTTNKEYESRDNIDDENIFSLRNIEKAEELLQDTIETLTQSLILKVENSISKKYALVFNSLIPERGSINLNPVSSYDFIIENIIEQVGDNLSEAGKQQIKDRFLKCFYRNSLPTLKANKITIPDFISLDEHFGDRISLHYSYNSRIDYLISALQLFLHDSTELPQDITSKLSEWKRNLDLSEHYPVFDDISFKFFKNRRIDVLFSNPTTARKFWNYYTLEVIEKIISENA